MAVGCLSGHLFGPLITHPRRPFKLFPPYSQACTMFGSPVPIGWIPASSSSITLLFGLCAWIRRCQPIDFRKAGGKLGT